jgi:hypothetical protein
MRLVALAALALAALALAACGSSKKSSDSSSSAAPTPKPATLALTVTETGKAAKITAPPKTSAGLVEVTLTNQGKAPHAAQLIRIDGNHTPMEALKIIGAGGKIPSWLHAAGGLGATPPGQPASAVQDLTAGKYVVADVGGPSSGPPAFTQLAVTGTGKGGTLPSTPTTITGAQAGKDRYRWDVSGTLKTGANQVTFASKGDEAIHFLGVIPLKGNPSDAQIVKGMSAQGKPPAFLDVSNASDSAALDGGHTLTTTVNIKKPGTYVLYCPLADRDGGKPHFMEGMIKKITVK